MDLMDKLAEEEEQDDGSALRGGNSEARRMQNGISSWPAGTFGEVMRAAPVRSQTFSPAKRQEFGEELAEGATNTQMRWNFAQKQLPEGTNEQKQCKALHARLQKVADLNLQSLQFGGNRRLSMRHKVCRKNIFHF